MAQRRAVTNRMATRYKQASRTEKTEILDQLVELTGWHRDHARAELRRAGATLNIFMLGDDPGLARFVDAVARRASGRVFTPDISRLGEYVVADYLAARRGRR